MQPWVYCSACERLVPGKPPCSREVDTGCEKAMWSPVLASFLAVVAGHLMVIFELSSGVQREKSSHKYSSTIEEGLPLFVERLGPML